MNKKFALLLSLFYSGQLFAIPFDYSMYNDRKNYECLYDKCFTLDEVVEKLKKDNYTVKKKLQSLIQVRHRIKVKLGRTMPSLSLPLAVSGGFVDFTAIPSLLGFLFPHNWYNWKESKLFYLAQRQSYKALLANEIATGVELYFILHKELIETDIYEHYYTLMNNMSSFFSNEIIRGDKRIKEFDIKRIESFKASSKIKALILQNEFKDTLPLLANLMAMPVDNRWDLSSIELLKLPHLEGYKKENPNAFYEKVIKLAPEIKTIDYLLLAADYSRKARVFSFLSPSGGVDDGFGYGYFSQLKIVKSEKNKIQIKRDESVSLLKVAIHALILNHNAAIETYKQALIGRENVDYQIKYIFSQYEQNKAIDTEQLMEALNLALKFDLDRNFSQHYFFANKSKMDRYLFQGKFFEKIHELIPDKKRIDAISSWRKSREDRKIARAIKKKKLKI